MPTQTPAQQQAAFQGAGLNTAQQAGVVAGKGYTGNTSPVPAPSLTMDAGAIQTGQTTPAFHFPSDTPTTSTSSANANSANTSIPTPQSIIQQEQDPTPAEATNTTLLQRISALMQGKTSLATNQTNAESDAGIPAMTKTVNDLSTQIQGLADQSTALQNAAGAGGSIENANQEAATGRGITTAGLAPLTASDLRKNQIQQSAISSQALTLKAAYYAANGNLTLAKDAADKSAQVQFDAEQQQIDYVNSLIDANKPQMTKEEKAQADIVTAQLADRQNAIDNAKADKVTAVGLAAAAMKNNPSDPTAQYAAQQVLQLNPDDPQYLTKVANLVGKFQTDPNDTALKLAQIAASRASTANSYSEIAARNDPANKPATQAQFTEAGYASRITQANSIINKLTPTIVKANPLTFGGAGIVPSFLQSSDRQQYEQAKRNFVNSVLRQESGAAISPTEFDSAEKQYFPVPGDSPETIQQKADNRALVQRNFINASGNAYEAPEGSSNNTTTASGKPFDYAEAKADGNSDADIKAYLASH